MSGSKFVELLLDTKHPQFLEGLDALLRLGLVSDQLTRRVGKAHFSSKLPDAKVLSETVDAIPKPQKPKVVTPKIPAAPTIWQRFLDELSVRWLLFLGVFLVVLSSGVLVASQWENFPVVGQYLVLWGYTVIFGFVGFWAGGQKDLKLTAQTLQAVAILLVPLNFWAVDEFNIWKSIGQSAVAIAAIFALLWGLGVFAKGRDWSKPILGGFLALGLCHWGWGNIFNPVIGVYLGIGVVIVILWGLPLLAKRSRPQKVPELKNIGLEFVLFGLGLLLFRAIAIENIPVGQLGFGLGLLGWLLTELEWDRMARLNSPQSKEAIAHPWETGGAILMLWGWLVTIGRYEWQVVGVSALAAIWLAQRLRRTWQRADLVALFIVGLQGGILCRDIIPTGFKASVTSAAVEFSQAQSFPYAVYSVTLLPYVVIWAIAALWLYRTDKQNLAKTSEYLLLGLGVILAGLSLPNATWRFLNFSVVTGIGFYFTHYSRPYIRRNYLYLCHGMGLLVIGSVVERFFSPLNLWMWGSLCLIALVSETLFCIVPTKNAARQLWQRSSWHYAIALAVGIWILYTAYLPDGYAPLMRSPWIIAPCCATLVALKKKGAWRRKAINLSTVGLLLLPCGGLLAVTIESPPVTESLTFVRLVMAIAAVVMWANVRLLPNLTMVHWHLGFITALVVSFLFQQVTDWQWLIVGSVGSGLFWGSAAVLQRRRRYLWRLYRRACHQWGLVCAGLAALFLTQHYGHLWNSFAYITHEFQPETLIGSALLLAVTVIYYWQNPKNEAFIIGGIALETCLTTTVFIQDKNGLAIASGNLGLAALFWVIKRTMPRLKNVSLWQAYPILFTILAFSWRFGSFNAFTGLWMFIASCLIFAISSDYNNRFLRFFGFVNITWGVYETVIYQMSQSTGNNIGDALTVFAFVGIILALIYRSLVWFQTSRSQEKFLSIPLKEILIAGHIHWAIAAGFKLLTLPYLLPEPPSFKILAIAVNICLAFYAFIQANNQTQNTTSKWSDWWIYVGALELVTTGIQARWMWTQIETIDPFRVLLVSLFALIIFQLPWKNMGWQQAPWHRVGVAMPALCIIMTASSEVSYLSLFSITCVYLRIAQIQKNVRWGYLSLIFGNWLIGKVLFYFDLIQPLSYALQIGLSILLIAQIDPDFSDKKKRKLRHYLRLLGCSIICVIALINYQQFGITPAIISFAFIFLGLGLQIRAFLYAGTVTLMMTGIYQLIILIDTYSFSKWVVGLVAGIILISIAANFEKRRLQIMTVLKHWVKELEQWQ
ncbi:MAG: hypothetical protein HC799_11855 [Limnothrix sp. RL_2_0]|nr:hypothetical protein [Limnothrix sp. RL_2_0]